MGADRAYVVYEEVRGTGQSIIAGFVNLNEAIDTYSRLLNDKEYDQDVLYLAEFDGENSKVISGPCPAHSTYKKVGTVYCSRLRGHRGVHFNNSSEITWGRA